MTQIPAPGQTYCAPPLSQWKEIAQKQRAVSSPLDALKTAWRREVAQIAQKYSARLGLSTPALNPAQPLLMSGHQPYLYHPGILYKFRLLSQAAETGCAAINLNVDTDLCEGFPVKLPSHDGDYHRVAHYLAPTSVKAFYADAITDHEALITFVQNAARDVATLPENIFEYGLGFLRDDLTRDLPDAMADAMTLLRRRYTKNWPGAVLEANLSDICATTGFFDFAFPLLQRGADFSRIFNASLERYRAEHKLRYPANPFPNLAQNGAGMETLFWLVKGQKRETLTVLPTADGIRLAGSPAEIKDGAALSSFIAENGYRLWPKAVALSLMNRLFLCDLFVHGIGGAKYDRITDEVIGEFYGLQPPLFAVASATLAPTGLDDPSPRLLELKQKLRETDFHPELFLENPPHDLLERKRAVLEEIKKPGADKKTLGKNLSEINARLNALLAPLKAEMAEKIASTEKDLYRYQTLADRELPFFLYPPENIPIAY